MTTARAHITGLPRILYTFKDQNDDTHVLVIDDDLGPMPNTHALKSAMLNARTPDLVRTMLFNELINRVRPVYERVDVAENVRLQQTADGFIFLEVALSAPGLNHVKERHTRKTGYYPIPDYAEFNPNAADAAKKHRRFSKRLKRALAMVGLYK